MLVQETYVNQTRGYRFGGTGWEEPWTDDESVVIKATGYADGRVSVSVEFSKPLYSAREKAQLGGILWRLVGRE